MKNKIKTNNFIIKPMYLLLTFLVSAIILLSMLYSHQLEVIFHFKPNMTSIKTDALEVHFVDVGQGDAILVRFSNNKTLIIDSGPKSANARLMTYIDKVFFGEDDYNHFDYMIFTHSDEDHIGGFYNILQTYSVGTIYRPKIYTKQEVMDEHGYLPTQIKVVTTNVFESLINSINLLQEQNKVNVIFNEAYDIITENDAILKFLSPKLTYYTDVNMFSPIITLAYQDASFMFTGDATIGSENEVINEEDIDIDVLKLGHHGSKTSTSIEFLYATTPIFAIVSAGKNNTYGHPSGEVIENIYSYSMDMGSPLKDNILQTADYGNIIFYKNNNQQLSFMHIKSVDDYLFIVWKDVAIYGSVVVIAMGVSMSVRVRPKKQAATKLR